MFLLILYNVFLSLANIIIQIYSIVNPKMKKFLEIRKKRFIVKAKLNNKQSILIHFSSVGEFNVAKPIIEKLINLGENVVLSVMTNTGMDEIKNSKFYNNLNGVIYFPLDSLSKLKKIYKLYNINKTIVIETEMWINLFHIASLNNRKLFIVNGRLSDKKMKNYMKFRFLFSYILNKVNKIMVQSQEDKGKYLKLLGDNENKENSLKILVHKNLKYYITYDVLQDDKKAFYYNYFVNKNKKIIVCGSTRPNEEKVWLNVLEKLNKKNNNFQLIIVPRHLDRISEILNMCYENKNNNIKIELFSDIEQFQAKKFPDILIVDKMGVLRDFYQLADYVFVGGTISDFGGHSILEPMYYGHRPLIGEYYRNIKDIVNTAIQYNYLKIVSGINCNNEITIEIERISSEIVKYISDSEKNQNNVVVTNFFPKKKEIDDIISTIIND